MTPITQAGATSADEMKTADPVTWVPSFRCPDCRGRSFARVDEQKPGGSFGPGPMVRCVECKRTYRSPDPFAALASPAVVPESVRHWPGLQLRAALEAAEKCRDLFAEIENDYTDPTYECRQGREVADAAVEHLKEAIADAPPSGRAAEGMFISGYRDDRYQTGPRPTGVICKPAPTPPASAGDVESRVEKVTRALLDNRGFHYAEDPMEYGQNAYDITNETRAEAIVALNAMGLATAPAAPEPAAGGDGPFRVGRKVARHVYEGDEPLFTASSDEAARRYVRLLNGNLPAVEHADAVEAMRKRLARAEHALRPFAALSFSFDGFSFDPAEMVVQGENCGRFSCKAHSYLQEAIDEARNVFTPTRADAGAEGRRA